jgi:hypothetical protein
MTIRAAVRQLPRNFFLAGFVGFILTLLAAFLARYWRWPWSFLPYGIDDPFGPFMNIMRNAFWVFTVLVLMSVFRNPLTINTNAAPILFLNIQMFIGEVFTALLFSAWRSTHLPWEGSALVLLAMTLAGQLLAYVGRKATGRILRPR